MAGRISRVPVVIGNSDGSFQWADRCQKADQLVLAAAPGQAVGGLAKPACGRGPFPDSQERSHRRWGVRRAVVEHLVGERGRVGRRHRPLEGRLESGHNRGKAGVRVVQMPGGLGTGEDRQQVQAGSGLTRGLEAPFQARIWI